MHILKPCIRLTRILFCLHIHIRSDLLEQRRCFVVSSSYRRYSFCRIRSCYSQSLGMYILKPFIRLARILFCLHIHIRSDLLEQRRCFAVSSSFIHFVTAFAEVVIKYLQFLDVWILSSLICSKQILFCIAILFMFDQTCLIRDDVLKSHLHLHHYTSWEVVIKYSQSLQAIFCSASPFCSCSIKPAWTETSSSTSLQLFQNRYEVFPVSCPTCAP